MGINSKYPTPSLKMIARIYSGGTPTDASENWDGDIPFVTPPDLNGLDGKIVDKTERFLTRYGAKSSSLVNYGVAVSCRAPIGHIGALTQTSAFNQGCKVASPRDPRDTAFLAYALLTKREAMEISGRGTTFTEMSTTSFSDVQIPWPASSTRRRITEYLDRETEQIDETIRRIDKVVELTQERNRSWLRDQLLSARYPRVNLGLLTEIANGSTPNKNEPGYWSTSDHADAVPWMTSTVVNQSVASTPTAFVTPRAVKECHLPTALPGDVLVAITGQGKTRGMATLLKIKTTLNQHVVSIRPKKRITSEFLVTAIRALYEELRRDSESNGSTRAAITIDQLERFQIPLPDLNDQISIASEMTSTQSATESMLNKAADLRELLQERRAALITAAVTGKIEV